MKSCIVFLVGIFLFINMEAQEDWSLKKCIEYAISHSFDVQQNDLNQKDAAISTNLAQKAKLPNLNASSNVGWNFGRSIDPTSNSFITSTFFANGFSVNSSVSLFEGGRLNKTINRNKINEKVAQADKNSAINQLTLNVVAAYFDILFAEDNFNNTDIQLKTITNQIDRMTKLVTAGSRAQFELYDLEAQKATNEQNLLVAENTIELAYLRLKALINLPPDYDFKVVRPKLDQQVYTNIESAHIEEVFSRALDFQPLTRSFELQQEAAAMTIDIAKTDYYPSLGASANFNTNYSNQSLSPTGEINSVVFSEDVFIDNSPAILSKQQDIPVYETQKYLDQIDNNYSYGFGVFLSIPIYNRGQVKANINRAKLNLDNVSIEKKRNEVDLRNNILQLLTDARAAKKSLEAAQRTLKARQIAFDNAQKRFDLGAINTYEFIGIQDQLNSATTSLLIQQYDYLMKVKVLDYLQGYPVDLD